VCIVNGHKSKGRLGQVSKIAQVALHQDLCTSLLKRTANFGNQAFEGEGDAFQKQSRERLDTESLIIAHKVKVQSQRARVSLFGESPHNYHMVNSSGLNLTCLGLLLGMQAEGHGDPLNQSSTLSSKPSLHNDICDIPLPFLQGKLATRGYFGLVGSG
jgi:hypothetical protein